MDENQLQYNSPLSKLRKINLANSGASPSQES